MTSSSEAGVRSNAVGLGQRTSCYVSMGLLSERPQHSTWHSHVVLQTKRAQDWTRTSSDPLFSWPSAWGGYRPTFNLHRFCLVALKGPHSPRGAHEILHHVSDDLLLAPEEYRDWREIFVKRLFGKSNPCEGRVQVTISLSALHAQARRWSYA